MKNVENAYEASGKRAKKGRFSGVFSFRLALSSANSFNPSYPDHASRNNRVMDSSLRTIALANRSGQIEGPIFARQKGNKLTLRAGRKIGRCRLAVIRTTTLRLPVLAAPLQPSPIPPPAAAPFPLAARARPPHHPRPCCALSVSPFRSLRTGSATSWLRLSSY